ncbi:MAG: thiamine phosphate synthase, partial [Candidatus Acidiferrum sp.]
MSLPNSSPSVPALGRHTAPILCYVTDRRSLQVTPDGDLTLALLEKISAVSAAGVDWIQVREKDLSGRDSVALVREALRRVSAGPGASQPPPRVIVNDRLDVAISEQAAGVHLGEKSLPVEEARRLFLATRSAQMPTNNFLIGVSCHSLEAAQSAASSGADYILFGPVFATPSKAAYGPPQGIEHLAEVSCSVAIPVLAIGGVNATNVSACFSAGASGVAAIRLFQDSPDPIALVRA